MKERDGPLIGRRRRLLWLILPLLVVTVPAAYALQGQRADMPREVMPGSAGSTTPEVQGQSSPASAPPATSPATASANCAAKPRACGFPDATTTGVPAGTTLTMVNGGLTVTEPGTVVESKDIRGCVTVKAPNVTIRRSKVTCSNFAAITSWREQYEGGGLLVEDVEIDCQKSNGTGVGSYGFVARRLNIHGCENGFDIDDTSTVEDSFLHDFYEGDTGHADGIQMAGGSHITIRHNTIFIVGGTSAIISHPDRNSDVLIIGNLLAGGAYTLYCPEKTSTAVRVIDNRFSTHFYAKGGAYGPWTDCEKVAELRGNVWDSDLQPLN